MAGDIDHADANAGALDFSVETRADDGVAVVTVVGQADLHTAPDLRAVLGDVVDGGSRAVLVDLTGATFIDSMTLGVLLGALKRLASVDGRLALVIPDRHVRRVFEITSLDRVFTIVDSLPEATSLLRDGGALGMTATGTTRITLEWPTTEGFLSVGRLVVGGVAARADIPVDRVDELGIALDTLAASVDAGACSLEIDVAPDRLTLSVGAFASDPLADDAVRRVVAGLVDEAVSVATGAPGHRVVLTTRIPRPA